MHVSSSTSMKFFRKTVAMLFWSPDWGKFPIISPSGVLFGLYECIFNHLLLNTSGRKSDRSFLSQTMFASPVRLAFIARILSRPLANCVNVRVLLIFFLIALKAFLFPRFMKIPLSVFFYNCRKLLLSSEILGWTSAKTCIVSKKHFGSPTEISS